MADGRVRALITDWGGVLTSPLKETIGAWIAAERIDVAVYQQVMREWVFGAYATDGEFNPIHALERGEADPQEFERALAAKLRTRDGGPVAAEGLLNRMFAGFQPVEDMYAALRRARDRGFRTGLLSNSWGNDYPRHLFPELFDAVVISSECGMRKPEERIFRYAVDILRVVPEECVFIDDIEHNVAAAEAIGMRCIHHVDVDATLAALEELLGVRLAARPEA